MSRLRTAQKFLCGAGRPDGVRLFLSQGNGFAADAYFPYWQYLLAKFDLVVFDFRNHGQNVPVVPPHHSSSGCRHGPQ